MERMQNSVIFASQKNSEKIAGLIRRIHQALDIVYEAELGHKCIIPDDEIIADALHDYLIATREATRLMLIKKAIRES